jgi:hypothetical protein
VGKTREVVFEFRPRDRAVGRALIGALPDPIRSDPEGSGPAESGPDVPHLGGPGLDDPDLDDTGSSTGAATGLA